MRPNRLFSYVAAAALMCVACAPADPSAELQQIADDYWERQLEDRISLRLRHGLPITKLPDVSLANARDDSAFAASIAARLAGLAESGLSHEEVLSRRLLAWQTGTSVEALAHYWLSAPVMPYSSSLRVVNQAFTSHQFDDANALEAYLGLLEQYPAFIRSLQAKLEGQLDRGIVMPTAEIEQVVPYLRALMGPPSRSPLQVASSRLERIDSASRESFQGRVDELIGTEVGPAYQELIGFVQGAYAAAAPTAVGLAQYPGGEQYYRYLVRLHTTMDVTPEDVHQVGVAEVTRLTNALDSVRQAVGFSGTRAAFKRFLKTDRRFYPRSPNDIAAKLSGYAEDMESKIDQFFLRRPRAPYGVARLARALEPAMTFGYYDAPTAARDTGLYYYNGSKLDERNLLLMEGLCYHELLPGHHFQINFQSENEALPPFRRQTTQSAYTEGWGDYSSNLGFEARLYQDPYSRAGRYLMEMFLAVRLVVDTGMNLLGWSRERAMDYMREHLIESETQIRTESLRYSVDIPGQALAYKMGSQRLLELRKKTEYELGDQFDVRAFHNAVLGSGSMPMTILEEHLEWFVQQQRNGS